MGANLEINGNIVVKCHMDQLPTSFYHIIPPTSANTGWS